MLGLAIGDALGAPFEGLKGPHILQLFGGRVEDYVDATIAWREKPRRWRLRGLHTDDTQQALLVAEVLLDYDEWDAKAAGEWLVAFDDPTDGLERGLHRGIGGNVAKSIRNLRDGVEPRRCGSPAPLLGAAMRIAPVGLWFAQDADALIDAALECSLLTDTSDRALLSAVAVASAVGLMTTEAGPNGKINAPEIAREIVDRLKRAEELLHQKSKADRLNIAFDERSAVAAYESLPTLLDEANDDLARKTILKEANRQSPPHPIRGLNQPFAPVAVPAAIYRALSARSLFDAIVDTINDGYDTDTVGAIVGAIVGARFGEGAIPDEWRDGLLAAETCAIRGEALALHEKDHSRWEDIYTLEYDWSIQEAEGRAELQRALEEERRRLEAKGKLVERPKRRERKPKEEREETYFDVEEDPSKRDRREREKARDQQRNQKRSISKRAEFMARGDMALDDGDDD